MTWIALCALYFLPTILARATRYDRQFDVFMFNVAFGWTEVVWLGLVVAVWEDWPWWRGQ